MKVTSIAVGKKPSSRSELAPVQTELRNGYQITEALVPVYFVQCGRRNCGWSWWARKDQVDFWMNEHTKLCKGREGDLVFIPPKEQAS